MTPRPAPLLAPLLAAAVLLAACGAVAPGGAGTPDGASPSVPATRPRGASSPAGATPRSSAGAPQETDAIETLAYGPHPDQVLDLALPDGDGPFPVAVLVHGGFWREAYVRDEMAQLVPDLVARGYAVANLEYRRVGGAGGYPQTLADVAAGLDHLAALDARLDLDRVAVVGHSAGGHLASWVGVRDRLPAGAVGGDPRVRPCAVVTLAGVNDLTRAARADLGGGATQDLLGGGPDEVPARYDVADPVRSLPPAAPLLAVHGRDDDTVPLDQSERFVADVVAAGGVGEVVVLPGDHFVVVDPSSEHWQRAVAWIGGHCGA